MSNIWEKFDKSIDTEVLKEEISTAAEGIEYREVPFGTYEVSIDKMELKESKTGKPMLSIWLKVIYGEHEGAFIFYNQVLHTGFGIHNANEFLRGLNSGMDVYFHNFYQYNGLILGIYDAICGKLEYSVEYGENAKGYKTYKVLDVFES